MFTFVIFFAPAFLNATYGHTVDSIGEYRLEIGWMNEPVVTGETNGIELFVSPLDPQISLEKQEFKNGISGLAKTLKIQLVYKDQKIMLPLQEDHNILGKYYAFVDPTVSGYYQANILGNIKDTRVSISMHPPKVDDRTYIEFPEKSNTTKLQEEHGSLLEEHNYLINEIAEIKNSINKIEDTNQYSIIAYTGVGLGIAGIVIASIAISKRG
jgi:hypothetical protein